MEQKIINRLLTALHSDEQVLTKIAAVAPIDSAAASIAFAQREKVRDTLSRVETLYIDLKVL